MANDNLLTVGEAAKVLGCILSFESRHGSLSYPCDTYTDWRDNLRAIALALEHLRAVDRYGVTKRGEQYRGWSQLPPPKEPQSTGGFVTVDGAARFHPCSRAVGAACGRQIGRRPKG